MQAAQDISFQAMSKKLTEVVDIIKADPDVADVMGFTGGGGPGGSTTNTARMFIALKPFEVRKATVTGIIGAAAQKARRGSRRPHLSSTGPGTADRRNDQQCRISIHPAGR